MLPSRTPWDQCWDRRCLMGQGGGTEGQGCTALDVSGVHCDGRASQTRAHAQRCSALASLSRSARYASRAPSSPAAHCPALTRPRNPSVAKRGSLGSPEDDATSWPRDPGTGPTWPPAATEAPGGSDGAGPEEGDDDGDPGELWRSSVEAPRSARDARSSARTGENSTATDRASETWGWKGRSKVVPGTVCASDSYQSATGPLLSPLSPGHKASAPSRRPQRHGNAGGSGSGT